MALVSLVDLEPIPGSLVLLATSLSAKGRLHIRYCYVPAAALTILAPICLCQWTSFIKGDWIRHHNYILFWKCGRQTNSYTPSCLSSSSQFSKVSSRPPFLSYLASFLPRFVRILWENLWIFHLSRSLVAKVVIISSASSAASKLIIQGVHSSCYPLRLSNLLWDLKVCLRQQGSYNITSSIEANKTLAI